jgi:hypothetical protein
MLTMLYYLKLVPDISTWLMTALYAWKGNRTEKDTVNRRSTCSAPHRNVDSFRNHR